MVTTLADIIITALKVATQDAYTSTINLFKNKCLWKTIT